MTKLPAPASIKLSRWYVKKALRAIMCRLPMFKRQPDQSLRALTYHWFGEQARDPFTISAAEFHRQMRYLSESGLALSPLELQRYLEGDNNFPGKVFITIDDGHHGIENIAAPILLQYNIGAVLFIVPPWLDQPGFLNRTELKKLSNDGFVIGSHSMTHRVISSLPSPEQKVEIEKSRETLEQITGKSVSAFAYPFGTRTSYSIQTKQVLKDAEYKIAFTTQHGPVCAKSDQFAQRRIKIEAGDSHAVFMAACRGGMDRWRWIDEYFSTMQRSPTYEVQQQSIFT
jgi:peptidoglycan/xylan/chitin deacetylase (PgdA/CDA1 family)